MREGDRVHRRLILAAALAATALAVPAATSAHVPAASIDCEGTGRASVAVLRVDLLSYPSGSHVRATVDGSTTLYSEDFSGDWHSARNVGSGYVDHSVRVRVTSPDDPDGSHGWTRTFDLVSPPCKSPPPHHVVKPPSASISKACGDPMIRWTLRAGSKARVFAITARLYRAGLHTWHVNVPAHGVKVSAYHHLRGESSVTIRTGGELVAVKIVEPAGNYGRCPR